MTEWLNSFTYLFIVVYLAYYSTLKLEVVCSSETSVNFYRTERCHISEISTLVIRNVFSKTQELRFSLRWLCRVLPSGI
jgi:hypothetical protein